MTLDQQLKAVTATIEDTKGEDIIVLKVAQHSADIEAIVIATGRSLQHVRGIANHIKIQAKRLNMKIVGIEGVATGQWILVDLAEVVVHIMTATTREFYALEQLWSVAEDAD